MISAYPIYCLACGDGDENTTASLILSSRRQIFQCFLKLFDTKWDGKAFSFCEECRTKLGVILELQRELQEIKQRLVEREKELRNKLECSEATFERKSLYSRDERYFKLRRQVLGDKVSQPDPQPADYLNGNKTPLQSEQPLLEHIKLELEEPQENTESYHSPKFIHDDDDNDDHEQMEESDQPNVNTGEKSQEVQPRAHRRSLRITKRKVIIDSPSESEEESRDLGTPSSSRTSIKRKRKINTVTDPDSDFEEEPPSAEDNKEFKSSEGEKSAKQRSSPKNSKGKPEINKGVKIITCHNIQLIRISEEEDNYKCSKCDLILPNKGNILRTHVTKEHTTRYECSKCFKRFGQSSSLSRHMEVYHRKATTPPYTCPICARPFFRAGSIKSHIWSHYSEQDKAEVVARGEKLPKLSSKKNFPCDQCFRAFATSSGLEKHASEQHSEEIGEKELCGICGARVINVKRHMSFKHVAEEDKRFECPICNKRFLLNCRLIKHRKLAHSNEKPWKCDVCWRDFKLERYLKEHKRGHENVKPFSCHICGIGFRLAYVLRRHVSNIHEGKPRADQKKSKKQLMKFEDV